MVIQFYHKEYKPRPTSEERQRVRSGRVLNADLRALSPEMHCPPGASMCSPTRKLHQASAYRDFIGFHYIGFFFFSEI